MAAGVMLIVVGVARIRTVLLAGVWLGLGFGCRMPNPAFGHDTSTGGSESDADGTGPGDGDTESSSESTGAASSSGGSDGTGDTGATGTGSSGGDTSTGGTSTLDCPPGTGDCDNDPDNGCETDLTSDDDHCGWCWHDCLGTSCVASMCETSQVGDPQGNPGSAGNGYLALSATHVYYGYNGVSTGGVAMVLKDGTDPSCVACDQGTPRELATDSIHVFWADQGQNMLRRALLDGTGATTIWNGQLGSPNAPVAVDGSHVYWFDQSASQVMRADPDGNSPLPIATGQANVNSIATDGTHVYWIAGSNVMAVDLVGGLPAPLCPGGTEPKSVAADGTHVYWAEGDWQGAQKRVRRVAKGGGVPEDIGTYSGAWAIALDATHVYCAGSGPNPPDNAIWRVPKSGGTVQIYATDLNYPFDVAVDATHVYWSSEVDGGVDRVAK